MSLATQLWSARRTHRVVEAADFVPPIDVAAAYATQAEMIRDSGLELAGWKIGATTKPALEMTHLRESFVGPVFVGAVFQAGDTVPVVRAQRPRLETEFTVILGADLPPRDEPYRADDININAVHVSYELVAARFAGTEPAQLGLMMIADGGVNGGMVMGAAIDDWAARDVLAQRVTVSFDGREVGHGDGKGQVWKSIVDELVWLANHPATAPRGLRVGDLVMTGTVAGLIPFDPAITARADYGPLGSLEARFVEQE